MKRFFSFFIILIYIFNIFPTTSYASDSWYFIVTAYYSPLPDQQYYITGSYESEKRLNGQWIAWASWKKVFSGMLAAPGKYSFWTKIYLEWLGIWSVEDRGGAIVPAWERWYGHDRIDVWVGYGDEWLRRAMYWGKRKIAGNIVSSDKSTSLTYESIPAPSWAVPKTTTLYWNKVQVQQSSKAAAESYVPNIFSVSLWKWSSALYVSELQKILLEVWYYTTSEITGKYDTHTIDAIFNFQVNNEILNNEYDTWAGSYGPKTRKKLKEIYTLHTQDLERKKRVKENIENLKNESYSLSEKKIDLLWRPHFWEISPRVRELQKTLAKLGYFDYKDTAIFWVKTQNAIINFQLDNGLIHDTNSIWAWVFWPKTREQMREKLWDAYFHETLKLEWIYEEYKMRITLESETKNEVSTETRILRPISV